MRLARQILQHTGMSRYRYMRILWAGLVLSGALAATSLASAETLRVGGTGAVTEMLRQLAPVFQAETGVTLEVIPGLGASGGNAAAADGMLGISVSGRDLKEEETAKGLKVAARVRTPFVLMTSRPEADGLKSEDIAAIYAADKPAWPDGSPIRIILRPAGESDNHVLVSLFPGMAEAMEKARGRSDLSVAATDQDNADAAEEIEGSLIATTLTQMLTEKRDLRFLAIDGVSPTVANYESGSYPYGKTLFLIVPAEISAEAASFLSFIATPEAEPLLREAGIVGGDE
jgi:phosphate transport system substrate-binding protein